jgi:hypothetical protein
MPDRFYRIARTWPGSIVEKSGIIPNLADHDRWIAHAVIASAWRSKPGVTRRDWAWDSWLASSQALLAMTTMRSNQRDPA